MKRQIATIAASALSAVAVGAVAQPAPAQAWARFGCKWAYGTTNIPLSPAAAYQTQVTGAANTWNRTSVSGKPNFQNISGSPVHGIEMLVHDFGSVSWDGYWTPSSCSGTWTAGNIKGNTYYYRRYTSTKTQTVLLHEMGHALGLAHSGTTGSCSPAAIMNPTSSTRTDLCKWSTPQADDINGLNAIY